MPIPAKVMVKLDPPELMKGRALPAKGINPTITNMLINASVTNHTLIPLASKAPNLSVELRAIRSPRHKRNRNMPITADAPTTPNSSPTTAKMLSV